MENVNDILKSVFGETDTEETEEPGSNPNKENDSPDPNPLEDPVLQDLEDAPDKERPSEPAPNSHPPTETEEETNELLKDFNMSDWEPENNNNGPSVSDFLEEYMQEERAKIQKENSFLWRWPVPVERLGAKIKETNEKTYMVYAGNTANGIWPTDEEYKEYKEKQNPPKTDAELQQAIDSSLEEAENRNQMSQEKKDFENKANEKLEQIKARLEPYKNFSIGFYRGDFSRLGFLIGTQAMDYWFYKTIKTNRLEYVFEKIESNPNGILTLLNDIENDPDAQDLINRKQLGFWKRLKMFFRRSNPTIKALKNYIKKNHSFVGLNPLQKETLLPNIAMLLGQEVATKMQNAKRDRFYMSPNAKNDSFTSFEKNEDGTYQSVGLGVSVVTLMEFFLLHPGSTAVVAMTGGEERKIANLKHIEFFGRLIGYEQSTIVKKVLRNPWTPFAMRLLVHFCAVRVFDGVCQDMWTEHLLKHRDDLKELLNDYIKAKKKKDIKQIKALRGSLKAFIKQGHTETSWFKLKNFYRWFNSKLIAGSYKDRILLSVVGIPVLYKIVCFYAKAINFALKRI